MGLAAIAAIGTVADMAPMTGESRAIVRLGLAELAETSHAGLRALLSRAVEAPDQPTARDLAFGVVPRINAAGRIADAELAIGLLLEEDAARAEELATELEAVHERRRELTTLAIDAARTLATATPGTAPLVLRDDEWAPGLVGLVAGRLCDELARPVAAATLIGDEVRGSVRAPADFHVASALEACAIAPDEARRARRRGRLQPGDAGVGGIRPAPSVISRARSVSMPPRLSVRDGRSSISSWRRVTSIGPWPTSSSRLAPYGPGHLEPVVAVTGFVVSDVRRVGQREQHASFRLKRGFETFDAVAFGLDAQRALPEVGDAIDLVGTVERDEFGGQPRLRLRVMDFAHADASPLLARRLPRCSRARDDGDGPRSTARPAGGSSGRHCASALTRTRTSCPRACGHGVDGVEAFARGTRRGRGAQRRGREDQRCLLRGTRLGGVGSPGASPRERAGRGDLRA